MIQDLLDDAQNKIYQYIDNHIIDSHVTPLNTVMRYAALSRGKCLRAFLSMEVAKIFEVPEPISLIIASAIELIHSYSLIHDDLPIMDNSDNRRGRASCHKKYGDASALLAGNGLMNIAFNIIANNTSCPVICKFTTTIEKILHGQFCDLNTNISTLELSHILNLYEQKTASMFQLACTAAAIHANANTHFIDALDIYGLHIGIAFQALDDISDNQIPKNLGKEGLLNLANESFSKTKNAIAPFGSKADNLKQLITYIKTYFNIDATYTVC